MGHRSWSPEEDARTDGLVHGPDGQGVDVVRYGKQRHGPQRYRGHSTDGPRPICPLESRNHGRLPAVTHPMGAMALHGSGRRDTARVFRGRPTTVIRPLKKKMQAYSKEMQPCSSVLRLSQGRAVATRGKPPRWMSGGAWSAAHASSGGCGLRLSTRRARSSPRSLAHARRRLADHGKNSERRGASRTFPQTGGGPIVVTVLRPSIQGGNNIRNRSNAPPPRCVPGSNAGFGSP